MLVEVGASRVAGDVPASGDGHGKCVGVPHVGGNGSGVGGRGDNHTRAGLHRSSHCILLRVGVGVCRQGGCLVLARFRLLGGGLGLSRGVGGQLGLGGRVLRGGRLGLGRCLVLGGCLSFGGGLVGELGLGRRLLGGLGRGVVGSQLGLGRRVLGEAHAALLLFLVLLDLGHVFLGLGDVLGDLLDVVGDLSDVVLFVLFVLHGGLGVGTTHTSRSFLGLLSQGFGVLGAALGLATHVVERIGQADHALYGLGRRLIRLGSIELGQDQTFELGYLSVRKVSQTTKEFLDAIH